ncbi:Uncharacterized protein Fot_28404 [Forsythia ovata]|uniref:Uncharacterized protein n=1 Tax=Forsythia ovata TaxID=205694 RepID=A0ABD1TPC5_9LAMI
MSSGIRTGMLERCANGGRRSPACILGKKTIFWTVAICQVGQQAMELMGEKALVMVDATGRSCNDGPICFMEHMAYCNENHIDGHLVLLFWHVHWCCGIGRPIERLMFLGIGLKAGVKCGSYCGFGCKGHRGDISNAILLSGHGLVKKKSVDVSRFFD